MRKISHRDIGAGCRKIGPAIDRDNSQGKAFWKKNAFAFREENGGDDNGNYISKERLLA